jgi:DNA-directed RNA polymerase specialized sigma24 family protein
LKYNLEESAELAKRSKETLEAVEFGFRWKSVLSCKQYVVVYLKIVKKLTYTQMADIMGLSVTTVRQHWHRAKKKLPNL